MEKLREGKDSNLTPPGVNTEIERINRSEYIKTNFGKLTKQQLIIILSIINNKEPEMIMEKPDGCRIILKRLSYELISDIFLKIKSFLEEEDHI